MSAAKNRILEIYATYVWPLARRFVKLSKRCRRCILSEKHGPLTNGLCQACSAVVSIGQSESVELNPETKARFENLVHSLGKGRDRKFDALLLLSGGKDSAYILDRMRTEYPDLRILCLFVENGFSSPVALRNAQLVAERCRSDLLIWNSRIDEFYAAFRDAFRSLQGRGSYGIVDFADGEKIFDTGSQTALGLDIPVVIGGLSWVQVQMIVGQDGFELDKPGQPKIIFPLAVWRTGEQEIKDIVRARKLLPPGSASPIVSNNDLILAMSAIDVLNLGYCSFEPEFAQLVREGKTDRNTWLHTFELLEFATTKGFLNKDIEHSLNKLGLTISDVVKGNRT